MLEPLFAPIKALQNLIESFDNQGIIIGGIAASLLGKPRLTADADAMILLSLDDIPRLIQLAKKEGLEPRLHNIVYFGGSFPTVANCSQNGRIFL